MWLSLQQTLAILLFYYNHLTQINHYAISVKINSTNPNSSILLTFYLLSYINDTTPKNNKIKAYKIKSSNITKQNKMKYNPNSQFCFSGAPAKCGDRNN